MTSQPSVSPDTTIADLAVRYPATIPVLERLGLDYCCGGNRPLGAAVADKGLDWGSVEALIAPALRGTDGQDDARPGADAPLSTLTGYIVEHYHAKLRQDLPRLAALSEKVINAHRSAHPELIDVAAVLGELRAELESHMMKEEHILFPFIEQLEAGLGARHPMIGHIASPIAVMEHEHESAGAGLAQLRSLTTAFTVPPDGCATFRAYYDGLAAFERDLHEHIHMENNILFPRAQVLESEVLASR
jgi:regulator of cell morphogenesis and NO signaling